MMSLLHRLSSRFVVFWILAGLFGCSSGSTSWYHLEGKTMGTIYHIQYLGDEDLQQSIDALLEEINQSVSTYLPNSTISEFNQRGRLVIHLSESGEPIDPLHRYFLDNLREAREIYRVSQGYFDPTVGPLVEAWGFGKAGHQHTALDSAEVNRLRGLVGFDGVLQTVNQDSIVVAFDREGMELDMSAIAKGFGVDEIWKLLSGMGISDCFVEIGGEVRVSGQSERGGDWIVGVNTPDEHAALSDISARIRLHNKAMATSGNYRNTYVRNGRKIWHTMNPKTGYPQETMLLSASVVHNQCMTADALATACMAMGVEGAINMIRMLPGAEGYFIYFDDSGEVAYMATDGLAKDVLTE